MPQLHTDSRNLYDLFYSIRRKINEISASYWKDLEIYNWLNQGQQYIARKTLCLEKEVAVTTTEGTREYNLRTTTNPFSDIIDISESGVNYDINGSTTNNQELDYYPIWKLNKNFPGWRGVSNSIPQYYYYKKAQKAIGIYPEPNSSNAGAYLHINGYHFPKVLNAGTAAAGSATTLTLATGSATVPYPSPENDYYNDLYIEIYQGTGAGEMSKITDYVGSTRVCTVSFTATIDTTSVYGMIPQIPNEMHYLIELYGLWKALEKGGSRKVLANEYRNEFFQGLSLAIDETIDERDEVLIKDTYRG